MTARILYLVTMRVEEGLRREIALGNYPRTDYFEIEKRLPVDVLGYDGLDRSGDKQIQRMRKIAGPDVALAAAGFRLRDRYDLFITNAERTGLPLALFLKLARANKAHCMVCHMLTRPVKSFLFTKLRLHTKVDHFVCMNEYQTEFLTKKLGVPANKVSYVHSAPVDQEFFAPIYAQPIRGLLSVGRELRDYETLISAMRRMPDFPVTICAGSLWSKRKIGFEGSNLPANVNVAADLDYAELRKMYASAEMVAIPLQDVDSPAGITTMIEAMAMAKPVILSKSRGLSGLVENGKTGIVVGVGDVNGWYLAIKYLRDHPFEARRMGEAARQSIITRINMDTYLEGLVSAAQKIVIERGLGLRTVPVGEVR